MWILTSVGNPELRHELLVGHDYTIGRRESDIIIPDDMSISRKHAVIRVIHPESNVSHYDRPAVAQLQDISKLGTQLHDERISGGMERVLKSGDIMVFGTAGISRYRVEYVPFLVTTSCLVSDAKKHLKQLVHRLGGHLNNDWTSNCSYVVMSKLSVTIKVISALLSRKLIVMPQFLDDLVNAIVNKTKHPDPNEYLPPLAESQISSDNVSFKENARRSTVFDEKTFIFLSAEQYKKLSNVIELGGATSQLWTSMDQYDEKLLFRVGACVMMCTEHELSQNTSVDRTLIERVNQALARAKRRLIAESEIGFSVLYCSVDRHCNPDVESSMVTSASIGQTLSQNCASNSAINTLAAFATTTQYINDQSESVVARYRGRSGDEAIITKAPVQIKEEVLSQASMFDRSVVPIVPSGSVATPLPQAPTAFAVPSVVNVKKRNNCEVNNQTALDIEPTDGQLPKRLRLEDQSNAVTSLVTDAVVKTEPMTIECSQQQGSLPFVSPSITGHGNNVGTAPGSDKYQPTVIQKSLTVESSTTNKSVVHADGKPGSEKINGADARKSNNDNECSIDLSALRVNDGVIAEKTVSSRSSKIISDEDIEEIQLSRPIKQELGEKRKGEEPMPANKAPKDIMYIKDEQLPTHVVVIEVQRLMRNRVEHHVQKNLTTIDSSSGPLKNFKKFKRSLRRQGLPEIIGRRDLKVHNVRTQQQEEWFSVGLQEETQRNNSDVMSQNLFNWEPAKRKR